MTVPPCVLRRIGGIQHLEFDRVLFVRHFTLAKIRQAAASEHEGLYRLLRVIGAIRSTASIVIDSVSLNHSIECLTIYFEDAGGSLLVAAGMREHSRDVTTLDSR